MNRFTLFLFALGVSGLPFCSQAQELSLVNQTLSNSENEPLPVFPVPTERQLKWNETEYYAFFHYGMNTYTGKEWGSGAESESTFAPTAAPNPRQWLETAKAAGMKGGIAVVKHHDGFCLWPTATTTHCVTSSSNSYAKNTNIPKDFAEAAQDLGMKYGFYVSPWDMNSEYWGNGTNDYTEKVFFPQCAELAQYGSDQFEMWFDGATGGDYSGYYGGAYETRTISSAAIYYDMPNLRDSIHNACPNIVMALQGGEVRWIGNESGYANETCWSMGSGESGSETEWQWHPGESDAKATTGWFWNSSQTSKSAETLFKMYLETVGRNATFLLNIPPDKTGSIPSGTVTIMENLGNLISTRLGTDLALNASSVTATATRASGATRNYSPANVIDGDKDTYWATDDDVTSASITLSWDEPQTIHYVALQEYIKLGQRVKSFTIETSDDNATWTKRGGSITTSTIGYKRIIPFSGSTSTYGSGVSAKYLRVTINTSKACPLLHTISVY